MSIYIGKNNDFEDSLKKLEAENEYHQVVQGIDHMSDLDLDNSFISNQWILIITLKLRNGVIIQQGNQR